MDDILLFNMSGNPIKYYYQWDSEQSVMFKSVDAWGETDVHFCNIDSDNALVVRPTVSGDNLIAKVPNKLLQCAKPLIIYLYKTDDDAGNNTVYSTRITVIPRPRPSDYVYTETDIVRYSQLDERIKALENGGVPNGVKSVNGIYPDQNGNIEIAGANIDAQTRVFHMNGNVDYPVSGIVSHSVAKNFLSNGGSGVNTGDILISTNGTVCEVTTVSGNTVNYNPIGTISGNSDDQIIAVLEAYLAENPISGETQYLHIRYSDNGERFTGTLDNLVTDLSRWESGYYGKNKEECAYAICLPEFIDNSNALTAYRHSFVREGYKLRVTNYSTDELSSFMHHISCSTNSNRDSTHAGKFLRLSIEANDTSATYETIVADIEANGFPVVFGPLRDYGEVPGAYVGLLLDSNEEDSLWFNRYTWIKLGGEEVDLSEAVNTALAQAKASGEFDGKDGVDGQPGKDGYTPVKGVDYFDGQPGEKGEKGEPGYTPQKGIDYFDGADGKDGQDGYTPVKGKDYFDGQPGADGKPGVDGKDGNPGTDGTSATHSWNGTVLTITSASGTSSANLKGEQGEQGESGVSIWPLLMNINWEVDAVEECDIARFLVPSSYELAEYDLVLGADGNIGIVRYVQGDIVGVRRASISLKGKQGDNGVSPEVSVSKSGKVTTITITDASGTHTATINDGADGSPGSAGKDGTSVTVKSVSESAADGGSNVVTFSDGKTVTVKNGSKGSTGANGRDGKSPVRGTDYWTLADQSAIIEQVIDALGGTPVFGTVDADNNIVLSGALVDGTYTIKYEDADGNVTEIGTIKVGATYTNQLPLSVDYDDSVFNGSGYQVGKRINSGGTGLSDVSNAANASNPVFVTGFIPCSSGAVVRFKNCYMATTAQSTDTSVYGQSIDNFRLMSANESKTMNWMVQWDQLATSDKITIETDADGNVIGFTPVSCNGFIRLVLAGDPETAIITINEEISEEEPSYTNQIRLSTTTPGGTEIYNGKGYKENTRWSSSSAAESSATGVYVTGCIPWANGATVYLKNIRMNKNDTASNVRHICLYNGTAWSSQDIAATNDFSPVWDADGNLTQFTLPNWGSTYFRLNTAYIGDDSILTINEKITESGDDMGDSGSIELVWAQGVKLDKDTGAEGTGDGYAASQHIELVDGYTYTFNQNNAYGGVNVCYYDANGTGLGYELLWDSKQGTYSKALAPIDGAATFRIRMYCGSDYSILTPEYFTVTYEKTV